MKYLFTIFLAVFLFNANAQLSGRHEQDSLLELKDKLYAKYLIEFKQKDLAAFDTYELYLWVEYQWLQWVMGKTQRRCIYKSSIIWNNRDTYIAECPVMHPGQFMITDQTFVGDTLIHYPLPINFRGFMDWKVHRKLSGKYYSD